MTIHGRKEKPSAHTEDNLLLLYDLVIFYTYSNYHGNWLISILSYGEGRKENSEINASDCLGTYHRWMNSSVAAEILMVYFFLSDCDKLYYSALERSNIYTLMEVIGMIIFSEHIVPMQIKRSFPGNVSCILCQFVITMIHFFVRETH